MLKAWYWYLTCRPIGIVRKWTRCLPLYSFFCLPSAERCLRSFLLSPYSFTFSPASAKNSSEGPNSLRVPFNIKCGLFRCSSSDTAHPIFDLYETLVALLPERILYLPLLSFLLSVALFFRPVLPRGVLSIFCNFVWPSRSVSNFPNFVFPPVLSSKLFWMSINSLPEANGRPRTMRSFPRPKFSFSQL